MKSHLVVLVLLIAVVAQAQSSPTIKPKRKAEAAAAKQGYRHVLLRSGQSVRTVEPKEAVMRAIAVRTDRQFDLSAAQQKQLERVIERIKQQPRDIAGIGQDWTRFVKSLEGHSQPVDLGAVMDHTIRVSLLETNGDLRFFAARAERLRSETAGTKRLVGELRDLKQKMRSNPAAFEEVTAQMLDAEIAKWQAKLKTVGTDAQMVNLDLQNAMQKQAQTMQMMSSILKALREQASAITQNVR